MTNRVFETCISITDNRLFVLIFFLNTFKVMIKHNYDIRINMSTVCNLNIVILLTVIIYTYMMFVFKIKMKRKKLWYIYDTFFLLCATLMVYILTKNDGEISKKEGLDMVIAYTVFIILR